MRTKLVILFICGLWLKANAQGNWTLKQCIDYGLKNNRNTVIYDNEKMAADARIRESMADYLPRVSLTSTLDNNLKLQQTVIPAGIFGPTDLKVSLTQKFSSNATAQLDQVIFDKSLLTGLKANKYYREQAGLNSKQGQQAIIYNISTAYFQIFVYGQQLALLEFNKKSYEKQIGIYRLQVSKGTTLQVDLDKVSVNYNNTISQIRVAENNRQLAQNQLKFEMGYPVSEPLRVDTSAILQAPQALVTEASVNFSPSSRLEYRLAELDIKQLQVQQASIKAEALPKLTAYARYGAVGYGNTLSGAYGVLLPFSTVGVKLNIPVLDFYKRNARYRQAEIKRMNAQENLKLSDAKLTMEYENANAKLLQAKTNMENDARNVTLATSVFNVTDQQLQKGVKSLADWLNAQYSLMEAQNAYLNSLFSYYLARIDLEKATGTLANFYQSL